MVVFLLSVCLAGSLAAGTEALPVANSSSNATARRQRGCDPLTPEFCMLPFPNNFWREGSNAEGFRLAINDEVFPITRPVFGSIPVRAEDGGAF